MDLPASIEVKTLDQQHPDYVANAKSWEEIELLYKDGAALKAQASRFLKIRPREPRDVYNARLGRFTSQPVMGSALGWYQSAMFANDPQVSILRDNKTVADDPFYAKFLANCDNAGKKFVDFARDVFQSQLLFRPSFVLTDRAALDVKFNSLAEQQAAGALDVHLVRYEPSQVINWETDAAGNYEWILIYAMDCERAFPGVAKTIDRWYYFDRAQCATYEAQRTDNGDKAEFATLAAGYPRAHALSAVQRVPVRRLEVPDGLWLGNRAYLSAKTHLNITNDLDWATHTGCYPTLYIKGDYKDDVTRSEVAWIALEENGAAGYIEPTGKCFEIAQNQKDNWREELYRQVYLQYQGRTATATPAAQSGYAKEIDMTPGKDVLNGLGDALRTGLTGVLMDVADARGEKNLTFTVKGLEFADNDQDIIARDESFLGVRLGPTVEKEVKKRLASLALKDSDQEFIDAAHAEIDAMPTDEEAAQADLQNRVMAGFKAPMAVK